MTAVISIFTTWSELDHHTLIILIRWVMNELTLNAKRLSKITLKLNQVVLYLSSLNINSFLSAAA